MKKNITLLRLFLLVVQIHVHTNNNKNLKGLIKEGKRKSKRLIAQAKPDHFNE